MKFQNDNIQILIFTYLGIATNTVLILKPMLEFGSRLDNSYLGSRRMKKS